MMDAVLSHDGCKITSLIKEWQGEGGGKGAAACEPETCMGGVMGEELACMEVHRPCHTTTDPSHNYKL